MLKNMKVLSSVLAKKAVNNVRDKMKERLGENEERLRIIIGVKEDYLQGRISLEEGRKILHEKIGTCTPHEFAYGEQKLKEVHDDEEITERMDDILRLFEGILVRPENEFPQHHPLGVYLQEIGAVESVLVEAEALKEKKFIKNEWLPIVEKLRTWNIHLSRKQNQVYPMLEKYDFDRPTKIMWTFDDKVRDAIREAQQLLEADKDQEFLRQMDVVIDRLRDLNSKETEVLIPTTAKLLTEEDFIEMSVGDHEIGFALIEAPSFYKGNAMTGDDVEVNKATEAIVGDEVNSHPQNEFIKDLAALLGKYNLGLHELGTTSTGATSEKEVTEKVLDVATGKLTLEQINLLFKHMPVDLSFVNEEDLVAFYSDTKHRIFPRSANVIGREVRNCHPRTSVHVVEEIIAKFKSGEEDQVDFWINKPGAFIYVLYTAVRDEKGQFRGVLEMMQDCTRIRSLEGSRTLLTWEK